MIVISLTKRLESQLRLLPPSTYYYYEYHTSSILYIFPHYVYFPIFKFPRNPILFINIQYHWNCRVEIIWIEIMHGCMADNWKLFYAEWNERNK